MESRSLLMLTMLTLLLIVVQADDITVGKRGCDYAAIQNAINAAKPGDVLEVQSGVYYENVNVTKPLVLKGIGMPVVDAGNKRSAITLTGGGITLDGFVVTNSGGGLYEAGIKVMSDNNTIINNNASDNSYSISGPCPVPLWKAGRFCISFRGYGIYLNDSSSDNVIAGNDVNNNNCGIYIGDFCHSNILYLNNFVKNGKFSASNARDLGCNQWDNGTAGNYYSDFNCTDADEDGICDSEHKITGGLSSDLHPLASPYVPASGSLLKLSWQVRNINESAIDSQAWMNKGISLIQKGKYEGALECFNKSVELLPSSEVAWRLRGTTLVRLNRYQEALESFDETLKINSSNGGVWNDKGDILFKLARYDDALECFNRSVELFSKYPETPLNAKYPWINRGDTLNIWGQYEESLKSYNMSVEIDPGYAQAWNNRVAPLRELNRYEEALESIEKATELDPDNADFWNCKCDILVKLGRYRTALECYDKVTSLQPSNPYFWNNRGDVLMRLNRYWDALESYTKATELKPSMGAFWHNKGLALQALHRNREAEGAFDKAKELGI